MTVICLDMEGVLTPEIWVQIAERTRIPELRLTTRDVPDYDVLMNGRLKILREHQIGLGDIQKVIAGIQPLTGAVGFLDKLRASCPVVILSDTFYEFAMPLMKKFGYPALFCNDLEVNGKGFITGYRLRQANGKEKSVRGLKGLGFQVHAAGDSYNDLTMLDAADKGVLFNPPPAIAKEYSTFPVTKTYPALLRELTKP